MAARRVQTHHQSLALGYCILHFIPLSSAHTQQSSFFWNRIKSEISDLVYTLLYPMRCKPPRHSRQTIQARKGELTTALFSFPGQPSMPSGCHIPGLSWQAYEFYHPQGLPWELVKLDKNYHFHSIYPLFGNALWLTWAFSLATHSHF